MNRRPTANVLPGTERSDPNRSRPRGAEEGSSISEQEFRISLGAYVLGALAPEENVRIEAHLQGCPDCRLEYLELSDTVSALAIVPPEMAVAGLRGQRPDPVGPAVPAGPAVLPIRPPDDETAGHRGRRRWPALAAAAAAAAVLVGGSVAGTLLLDEPGRAPAQALQSSVAPSVRTLSGRNAATGVSAVVTLRSDADGTYLDARVSGDLRSGWQCELFAVPKAGSAQSGGSNRVDMSGTTMHIHGSVAVPVDGIARIDIRRADGTIELLALPL